jgi:hypothetical protein
VVWLPAARLSHSERRVEQVHILKAIQQTMLAYGHRPERFQIHSPVGLAARFEIRAESDYDLDSDRGR